MSMSTDLATGTSEQETGELAVTTAQAMARHEIEGAIIIANRFPRNEGDAFGRIMESCKRFTFAGMAVYSYPRGGQQIEGPSVNLAREAARCWGNIRYGCDIVHDDDENRTVRGWAWDLQTNTKETQDATFAKLIYRKKGGWIKPDERDLRELTNKHGAICVRNCLVHLMPPDLTNEAMDTSKATVRAGVAQDMDAHRKKMIVAFRSVGVTVEALEAHLGHPLSQAHADEVANLRTIYKSIADGNSTWSEYAPTKPATPAANGGASMDDLVNPTKPEPEAPTATKPPSEEAAAVEEWQQLLDKATTIKTVDGVAHDATEDERLGLHGMAAVDAACDARRDAIRAKRGPSSNAADATRGLFETEASATEAGQ